ncbi:MAG: isopeptide-forming domain-containing fimbrial protein [Solirubrobacterales bacterium]
MGFASTSAAQAAGTPDLQLSANTSSPLYGTSGSATTTASLAAGQPKGYNLSFRVVLPAGITYAGGADPAPQIISNQPGSGQTTLIFSNVSDVVSNSSQGVDFNVSHNQATYEVGDTYGVQYFAYVNSDPRYLPKFSSTGIVDPTSYTGSASATSTGTIRAIDLAKSEPSREGEILRGVHDNQTVYTLTLKNNEVNPTESTKIDDFLPAGLEFLGCENDPDNTTDAPSNPGSPQEYPGSGPIVVKPVDDCHAPTLVETINFDPDGAGPKPSAVYTHVQFDTGTLAPGQTKVYRYRAAVPLRENTLSWTGTEPTSQSGKQATNLDNNSGPEVRDEQPLTNYALAGGTYKGDTDLAVTADSSITRTAEDLVVYKSASTGTLAQGGITEWELRFRTGEYRYSENIVVTDTLPSGYCPLGPVNYTTGNDASDSECDPTGANPSAPYKSVTENADGTFTIVWDKSNLAKFGHTNVNDEFVVTFPTRTRSSYQANFEPTTPILAKDSTLNKVALTGETLSRCVAPGTPDCSTSGPIIWSDELQPQPVIDASQAGQVAPGVSLKKEVSTGSTNCTTATYSKTTPQYNPGDKVCWRLTIDFPSKVDTRELRVTDFLPLNTTYVAGSAQDTANNTTTNVVDESAAASGNIFWDLNGGLVPLGSQKFQVTLATTVAPAGIIDPSDVKGNLIKFGIRNTPGTAFPLRDQVNYESIAKRVTIKKGVRQINSGAIKNPPVDGLTVTGGDSATYQVDVTAIGDVKNVQTWDRLPAFYDCSMVSAITDGGTCVDGGAGRDIIKWNIPAITDGATKSLTYKVQLPNILAPENTYTNDSGVRQYESTTNTGSTFTYVPENNIDPTQTPNIARVDDPSNVKTPNTAIAKVRHTSITEAGNTDAQATIGERIDYTVTTTLPAGTTFPSNLKITDTPNAAATQPIIGTPTATLNGNPLPAGWAINTAGQTVTVTGPDNYSVAPGANDIVVISISTRVADVSANVRGQNRTNQANLSWTDGSNRSRNSNSVSTTIVEPVISQSKSNNVASTGAQPNEIVTYTLTTRNSNASNVAIAHDTIIKDVIPVGVTLVDGSNNPLADGAVVPGTGGGTWNAGTRTITGTPVDINPNANVVWSYRAKVDSPAITGTELLNTADAKTTSIDGTDPNERTSGSTTNTGYSASSSSKFPVAGATIVKSVTPSWTTIGTPVTYTADLTIPKNLKMFNLTAFDVLPDSLDFDGYVSANCISGCPADPAPNVQTYTPVVTAASTTLAWDLGTVNPGTGDRVIRFTYKAHVRDTHRNGGAKVVAGENIVNTILAQSNISSKFTFNPNNLPGTGTFDYHSPVSKTTTPVREPKLVLDKRVKVNSGSFVNGPVQSQPGDNFTYSVAVTNNGTSAAYDVKVSDQPDADLTNVVLADGAAFNTDPWTAGDPAMTWVIPGPINPGQTVTLTYTAKALPSAQLNATDTAVNTAGSHYFGIPSAERTNPWTYREYDSNDDTVIVKFEFPEITVDKTTTAPGNPDIADANVEQPFGWRIVVKNNATTATALDTVVRDTLPPAWTYDAGSTVITGATTAEPSVMANASGDVLTWDFAGQTIQPGASVVIKFTATPQLPARLNPPVQTNDAKADSKDSSGSPSNEDGPYRDEDDAKATLKFPIADLDIDKIAPEVVEHDEQFTYTIKVNNKGPNTATQVVITDPLPAGLAFISSAECTSAISCNLGTIPVGGSKTVNILVSPTLPVFGEIVTNTATVEGHEFDPNEKDNTDTVKTEILGEADVKITKTADPSKARPGDIITFHLKAENVGTAMAEDVVITDTLPAGLSFVSADAPCVEATATVTCEIGDLKPGETKTYDVKVKVDPWGDADPAAEHLLDVQKVEAQIDLEAGQQKTVSVTCPANYFASDGSVRIDQIDQGTGDWTSPQVLESYASAVDTWKGTVKNTATGRAQAKIFAVCIKRSTSDDGGHSHDLITSDPITVSNVVLAGKNEFTLVCGPGQVAIQPGFQSSTPANLVYSEPEGNGWKFILDNSEPADVTVSIRCMTRQVTFSDGHTHDLRFEHIVKEFTIPAGTVSEAQLTCADGYKGIVADMDLDDGLVSLGNDPRPVTRAFKIYNPTDHDLKARLSLLCLGDRTQGEHLAPVEYTNTAYISTSSDESVTANNHSSASVVAEDTDNNDPIDPVDPVKPTPNNPVATKVAGGSVKFNGKKGVARIKATGPTSGVAKLVTTKKIKIKGKKFSKGTLIASGKYSFTEAGSKNVKLKTKGKRGAKLLKKSRKGLLKVTGGTKKIVRLKR